MLYAENIKINKIFEKPKETKAVDTHLTELGYKYCKTHNTWYTISCSSCLVISTKPYSALPFTPASPRIMHRLGGLR